jgi:RNA-binding protein PNO1
MVVAQQTIGTSTSPAVAHKKNRRKMSKKTSSTPAPSQDEDMQDLERTDITEQVPTENPDDAIMIDDGPTSVSNPISAPHFPPAAVSQTKLKAENRRIPIPPHRMTPLKKDWINIFGPLTEMLGLQIRMNVQRRAVEIRVSCIFSFFFRHASWSKQLINRRPNTQKTSAPSRRVLIL